MNLRNKKQNSSEYVINWISPIGGKERKQKICATLIAILLKPKIHSQVKYQDNDLCSWQELVRSDFRKPILNYE